jgi:hypothetical protein
MKTQNRFRKSASALMALSALITLTPRASAINLVWVDGPQAGQAFTGGGIQIKAVNYDTGTLYNPITVGTSVGFGVGGGAASVAAGETALNAPAGILRPILSGNPAATEDSWGIVRITNIQATASDGVLRDIYNSALAPVELTAMFWGVRDFYLTQVSAGSGLPGGGQIIDGTNLRVDIYSDPSKNFNQTLGPGGRTGISSYPTVTDGTLELSLLSTPGFINANGTLGGAATEFESNTANVGYAALNVIGGASAAQFNTNAVGFGGSSGASFLPGVAGSSSMDIWFSFTSTQGVNGWDITSNDPMLANIATGVPDSGSALLMFALGLAGLGFGCRRFSRKD